MKCPKYSRLIQIIKVQCSAAAVILSLFNVAQASDIQELMNPPKSSNPIWVGADIATSISDSDNRLIWLFGDTLIGRVDQHGKRELNTMMRNSVGIQPYNLERCQIYNIQKIWARNDNSELLSKEIFTDQKDPKLYYWPTSGIFANNLLFIAALKMATDGKPLTPQSTVIIKITNPNEEPASWKYNIEEIPDTDGNTILTSAMLFDDRANMVRLFGFRQDPLSMSRQSILSSISVSSLSAGNLSALKDRIVIPGLPATSEASILYNNKIGWFTIHLPYGSNEVILYRAQELTGPWKQVSVVHTIKQFNEQTCVQDNCKPTYIKYAPKLHEKLSSYSHHCFTNLDDSTEGEDFIMSYNVNINPELGNQTHLLAESLKEHPAFYVPQFVRVHIQPKTEAQAH